MYRHNAELVLDVLGDETARTLFSRISECPQSANELQEACSASLKTVYRRLETMQEAGLISPVERIDEDGTHYTEYSSAVDELEITVKPDESSLEVHIHQDDSVDNFVSAWSELQQ